jgi:hypothetical protein
MPDRSFCCLPPNLGWRGGAFALDILPDAVTSPSTQGALSTHRVTLDPIDSLSGQASFLRDLSNTHRLLPQHGIAPLRKLSRRNIQ